MKKVIIVDFDGTIVTGITPHAKVIDFLNEKKEDYDIIVVTDRPYGKRYKVEPILRRYKIDTAAVVYGIGFSHGLAKSAVAERILRRSEIALALDNDPEALIQYRKLGIRAVHPNRLDLVSL